MKKMLLSNLGYIVLIVALIVIQLYFSFLYRQIAVEADKIDIEYRISTQNIQKIKSEIAENSSLSNIEIKAKKLGFIRAENFIYSSTKTK